MRFLMRLPIRGASVAAARAVLAFVWLAATSSVAHGEPKLVPVPAGDAGAPAPPASEAPPPASPPPPVDCAAWDATYNVSGELRITETQMGAGDGTHHVGPGTLVLRFIVADDAAKPPHVELRGFELHQRFSVEPKGVFWSATVATDALARATPNPAGVAARGILSNGAGAPTLRWDGPVSGYRVDGVMNCTGSLCGKFGAPPPGRSPTGTAPHPVKFEPLRFGGSGLTFEMLGYSVVSQDESPRQKTALHLFGKASRWVCAQPRTAVSGGAGDAHPALFTPARGRGPRENEPPPATVAHPGDPPPAG